MHTCSNARSFRFAGGPRSPDRRGPRPPDQGPRRHALQQQRPGAPAARRRALRRMRIRRVAETGVCRAQACGDPIIVLGRGCDD